MNIYDKDDMGASIMRRKPMATALRTCCAERIGAMQPRQLVCIDACVHDDTCTGLCVNAYAKDDMGVQV